MGSLRQLSPLEQQSFPGAIQAAEGTIPLTQCTQATYHGYNATTYLAPPSLAVLPDPNWTPDQHIGKLTRFRHPDTGQWEVLPVQSNTSNVLHFTTMYWSKTAVHWYIGGSGPYAQQQTAQSFMADCLAAGYAATMKSGVVYTNCPILPRNAPCYILSDPIDGP